MKVFPARADIGSGGRFPVDSQTTRAEIAAWLAAALALHTPT